MQVLGCLRIGMLFAPKSGKRYTGHTSDLNRRLKEHNSGMCKSTKIDIDWKVIYAEEYPTRSEAMKREKWLKSGRGSRFLKTIMAEQAPDSINITT
jgi:putative endonuclease